MNEEGLFGWIREHWGAWAAVLTIVLAIMAKTRAVATAAKATSAWVVLVFGAAQRVLTTLEKQNVQLSRIEGQLLTNGGESLRDEVIAIRRSVLFAEKLAWYNITTSDAAIYRCDAEGNCVASSPGLCQLFGLSEGEMMVLGWLKSIHEEDVGRVMDVWKRSRSERIPYECQYRVVRRDLRLEYKCHTSAQAVLDKKGNPIGYIGSVVYS